MAPPEQSAPRSGPPVPAKGPSGSRFDLWAPTYDDSELQEVLYGPVHHAVLRHVAQTAPRGRTILDIGCGTGRLIRRAAHVLPQARLVGVDPAAAMIERARSHERTGHGAAESSITFVQAQAEQLPFRDDCFDLVLSTFSLRHWHGRTWALAEVSRVAAPNGILVLADAADRLPRARTARRTPRTTRSLSIERALTTSGFTITTTERVPSASLFADVFLLVAIRRTRPDHR